MRRGATHPTLIQATLAPKQFKAACTFSGSPKGAWAAIDRLTSGLRSFEQKPRACVPHTPYIGIGGFVRATACYVGTEGFVQATACYSDSRKLVIKTSILSINLTGTITVYSKFSSNELLKSYIAS